MSDGLFYEDVFYTKSPEWWKEAGFDSKEEIAQTIKTVAVLLKNPKGSIGAQLLQWRKIGGRMLLLLKAQHSICQAAENSIKRANDKTSERSHKKWSSIEDEQLIDAVSRGDISIIELSCLFGRSPSAIKSRVSYLVGIKRVSSEIAGSFIGTINGASIEGNIRGQLTKLN